jgi:hypothetical protein
MDPDEELLDREQANAFLHMRAGFLTTALRSCEGPPYYRLSRTNIRYKKSELSAGMQSRQITPPRTKK